MLLLAVLYVVPGSVRVLVSGVVIMVRETMAKCTRISCCYEGDNGEVQLVLAACVRSCGRNWSSVIARLVHVYLLCS